MPSFEEFSYFGLFPEPATNTSVNWFGSSATYGQVPSTNSVDPETSVPFWWLFYKLKLNGSFSFEVQSLSGGGPSVNGDFNAEFFCHTQPKDRSCPSGDFSNLLEGGDATGDATINGLYDGYSFYNIRPFQCDNLHAFFLASTDTLGTSPMDFISVPVLFYATTCPEPINYNFFSEDLVRAYSSTHTIVLPNGNDLTLNLFVDMFDAGYVDYTYDMSCQITEIEFYTL